MDWEGWEQLPRSVPCLPSCQHTSTLFGSAQPCSARGAVGGLHQSRRLLVARLFLGSADPARASRGPQRLCGCLVLL